MNLCLRWARQIQAGFGLPDKTGLFLLDEREAFDECWCVWPLWKEVCVFRVCFEVVIYAFIRGNERFL